MSGGHFDYAQYRINDIIVGIEELIKRNNVCDEQGYCNEFSKATLLKFKEGVDFLRVAGIYAQRIDWLACGDDSEETFHERLKEDFNKATKHKK